MIYRGACHCGAVSAAYETHAPVRLRQDGCSFCASRGVKSASDPDGSLAVSSTLELTRYRFGHASADFLICPTCGTYVATYMEGPRGPVGVINVVGLNIPELRDEPATLASLEGEMHDERIARRLSRWTPMTLAGGSEAMSEGEVVEQLIGYMSLLLLGVSIIFTVVSTYIVALNYFVGEAQFIARLGAFAFVSLILTLLLVVMIGAESTHAGLIERLRELQTAGQLTAAGAAALANAAGGLFGIDGLVRLLLWIGMISVYVVLAYMTFMHRWKPDIVNVAIAPRKAT